MKVGELIQQLVASNADADSEIKMDTESGVPIPIHQVTYDKIFGVWIVT